MVRFLHPLAFFAAALLLIGLVVIGAANSLLCADGCSSTTSDFRTLLSLALLGPGLGLGVVAWDLAFTASITRRAWRTGGLLFGIPVLVWVALLAIAPTLGIPALGEGRSSMLATAIQSGALTLLGLMSVLFVLPTPATTPAYTSA
jgi:hypothetical protein